MRAFIIRPFGKKNGIDFDEVEATLIQPALARLHIPGVTALSIAEAGSIRVDMFQKLLTADLVVADISIGNANVFYELGIRHALRDKRTLLIRAASEQFPFELAADRYLEYDPHHPAASLPLLVKALAATIASESQDSPVFKLLPNLQPVERSTFIAVPLDFREEVDSAASSRDVGRLDLMVSEVDGFDWSSEGLRVLGRALFNARAFPAAIDAWERIRELDDDVG